MARYSAAETAKKNDDSAMGETHRLSRVNEEEEDEEEGDVVKKATEATTGDCSENDQLFPDSDQRKSGVSHKSSREGSGSGNKPLSKSARKRAKNQREK